LPEKDLYITTDTLTNVRRHPLVEGFESVLIVSDRNTYIAGENVWYTMFLQRTGIKDGQQSKAGYAEILNSLNNPVSQSRILLDENSAGSGVLLLPDTIASGDYILRGYTTAMAPFGADHFFTTKIRVFNPYGPGRDYNRISIAGEATGPSLALYPEGGTILPGVANKIVVRTTDRSGGGAPAKVFFTNQEGTVSDSVITDETGLASVIVIPSKTGPLIARAIIESGSVRAELPTYMHAQYSLACTDTGSGKKWIIIKTIGSAAGPLHLSVISPGKINYYRQIGPVQEETVTEIPYSDLSPGINEALLYDNRGNLLASRLFMNYKKDLPVEAGDDIFYSVRNDTLTVRLPQKIASASVSVIVSDDHAGNDLESYAILAPWLTAITMNDPFMQTFLKGSAEISDDLLITLNDKNLYDKYTSLPVTAAETRGLMISGIVTDLNTLRPAGGRILFLNLPGKECFLQYARSDTAGRFRFIIPPRRGSGEIVVYPQDTLDNVIIKISSPFSDDFIPFHRSVTSVSDEADESVLRMSVNSQVMKIFDIRNTDTLETSKAAGSAGHFYGSAGYHLLLSDFIPLPNMEEIFFELIPDIDLVKSRRGYSFRMFDPLSEAEIRDAPLMFIDGIYTTDPETIAELAPDKTEYIDVILLRYRLGEVLLPPVISVITKTGDYRMQSLPEAALKINYLFTDPDVKFRSFAGDRSGRSPVLNNTLLWAPMVTPDGEGEYSFRLPHPDYQGPFRIDISVSGTGLYPFNMTEIVDINQP
jgi:hypothetical protein